MRKVSLIVATLGERPFDLWALLLSLKPQAKFIKEVIIVDQHPDPGFVPTLLKPFHDALPIIHTRSRRGLSRARNHGLTLASGDFVAFPDDDCLYPEGLLEWVVNWFETNFEFDILAVGATDAEGLRSGNRWFQKSCEIKPFNAFRTTFSPSLFLWSDLAQSTQFDEQLGIGSGTQFGSGEETDYVLRLLRTQARGRFDRTRHIVHPRRDMLSDNSSSSRAFAYGVGTGHVLRINSMPVIWAGFLTYNLLRAGLSALRGQFKCAHLCVAQTLGFWKGFLASKSAGGAVSLNTQNSPSGGPSLVNSTLPMRLSGELEHSTSIPSPILNADIEPLHNPAESVLS